MIISIVTITYNAEKVLQRTLDSVRSQTYKDIEHLIIDGLRVKEHSTHFNFLQALDAAQKIGANHVWLIHLTHNLSHVQVIDYINEHLGEFPKLQAEAKSVLPAYDGLEISC
jgi:phosphoribosyl 1,2-cyclic phosphate phosphodiesterase